jgi:chromosome segregation ATPase
VLGAIVLVCVARHIVKRRLRQEITPQVELLRGCTVVVASEPEISIVDNKREHRERIVTDVTAQEGDERLVRWLEEAPNHFRALHGILRDYDRAEKVTDETEQENQRLREAACLLEKRLENSECDRERLQQEVRQLNTTVEQYRREIAMTMAALVDGLDHLHGVFEGPLDEERVQRPGIGSLPS